MIVMQLVILLVDLFGVPLDMAGVLISWIVLQGLIGLETGVAA